VVIGVMVVATMVSGVVGGVVMCVCACVRAWVCVCRARENDRSIDARSSFDAPITVPHPPALLDQQWGCRQRPGSSQSHAAETTWE
jgi:hypothetical protein